jgi:hypothetical protein
MELHPQRPSTKGPAEMFTGDVWFDVIAQGELRRSADRVVARGVIVAVARRVSALSVFSG